MNGGPPKPPSGTAFLLLGDLADVTWRMFIPTIGTTLLGLWADKQLGTSPWFLIAGIVLGAIGAALLVRRQLKRLFNDKEGSKTS